MGKETERKFLVKGDAWRTSAMSTPCRQGYLVAAKDRTVRVRVMGGRGFLTIKGPAVGASRPEYEYEIPVVEADEILTTLCERPLVEKTRHTIQAGSLMWEIDEFSGDNQGLIVAELELEDPLQEVDLPPWVGEEVTGRPEYFNANLAKAPFKTWKK